MVFETKNFRLTVCLHNFFNDHRSVCKIFVGKRMRYVRDLETHIASIFNINNFYIVCNNQFLPSSEDVRIIQPEEVLTLIPIRESNENGQVSNSNNELNYPQNVENEANNTNEVYRKKRDETALPSLPAESENDSLLYDSTIERDEVKEKKKKRSQRDQKKKKKRKRSKSRTEVVCDVPDDNKVHLKKRKCKKKCNDVEIDNNEVNKVEDELKLSERRVEANKFHYEELPSKSAVEINDVKVAKKKKLKRKVASDDFEQQIEDDSNVNKEPTDMQAQSFQTTDRKVYVKRNTSDICFDLPNRTNVVKNVIMQVSPNKSFSTPKAATTNTDLKKKAIKFHTTNKFVNSLSEVSTNSDNNKVDGNKNLDDFTIKNDTKNKNLLTHSTPNNTIQTLNTNVANRRNLLDSHGGSNDSTVLARSLSFRCNNLDTGGRESAKRSVTDNGILEVPDSTTKMHLQSVENLDPPPNSTIDKVGRFDKIEENRSKITKNSTVVNKSLLNTPNAELECVKELQDVEHSSVDCKSNVDVEMKNDVETSIFEKANQINKYFLESFKKKFPFAQIDSDCFVNKYRRTPTKGVSEETEIINSDTIKASNSSAISNSDMAKNINCADGKKMDRNSVDDYQSNFDTLNKELEPSVSLSDNGMIIHNDHSPSECSEICSPASSDFITKRKRKRYRKRKTKSNTLISTSTAPNNAIDYRPRFIAGTPAMHIKFNDSDDITNCSEINVQILEGSKQSDHSGNEDSVRESGIDSDLKSDLKEFVDDEIVMKNGEESDKEIKLSEETINMSPLMNNIFPKQGELIAFKIFRLNDDYNPVLSSYIVGKVVVFNETTEEVTFELMNGVDQCQTPKGKFFIDAETEEHASNWRVFNWGSLIEPRLVFP